MDRFDVDYIDEERGCVHIYHDDGDYVLAADALELEATITELTAECRRLEAECRRLNSPKKVVVRDCINNSAGFGGIVPDITILKFLLNSLLTTKSETRIESSIIYSVNPLFDLDSAGKYRCNWGFLISAPTNTTFFPVCANDKARLKATKVFPSPLIVEVTKIFFADSEAIPCDTNKY